ncbi:hypothetical protein [Propionibacterium freudenreichii]|uniref:hypothetical protein n=1 Tax=Propionibacterium freudenreichii TaxID=1744 RepID=UPI000BC31111|nr:hypothetical protein [Propionibacterium freudenreichii]MCT2988021.1 hypothetical protein [Propionibacterium freudenreichii]MCT2998993.1 hypothetical protein [Propionibacterium freudenreichii]MCT3003480.1 hypothetical protein [Propionibacterium freudenreichii]MDK9661642.1 hypothetical protein [Propionibacterium freudenreichii]SBN60791.1 Hypothetical protein PFR_JS11_1869 [Propionibacterium freudenreichii]
MDVALGIAGTLMILLALDRALRWMERRGWIYYRKRKRTAGVSLGPLFEALHPSHQYVATEQQRQSTVRKDSEDGQDRSPREDQPTVGPDAQIARHTHRAEPPSA